MQAFIVGGANQLSMCGQERTSERSDLGIGGG